MTTGGYRVAADHQQTIWGHPRRELNSEMEVALLFDLIS